MVFWCRVGVGGVCSRRFSVLLPCQRAAAVALAQATLAGGVPFAHQGGQQLIAAQPVVIIQVLIAEGQGVDALAQQMHERVLRALWIAVIGKPIGQSGGKVQPLIDLAQERSPTVGGELHAVKGHLQTATLKGLEL